MEELVKKNGFESLEEFHKLVANADLSSKDKIKAFEDWKENDGTKEGLLKLENNPSIKDKYYQYTLEDAEVSLPEQIVFNIVNDFTDRRGLRQEWDNIDDDIQCEIMNTWIEKTKETIKDQVTWRDI